MLYLLLGLVTPDLNNWKFSKVKITMKEQEFGDGLKDRGAVLEALSEGHAELQSQLQRRLC